MEKGRINITEQSEKAQEENHLQSRNSTFINGFQIGTALNQSGIKKIKGASPFALFTAIFQKNAACMSYGNVV